METFGERLEYLIKQSDYKSTAKFSKDVGVSAVTMSNIKRGETDTTISKVRLMVKLLREHGVDVDYDWLMDGNYKIDKLSLENRELKERVSFYKSKLGSIAKHSSNRINPRQSRIDFDPKRAGNYA